MKKNQESARLEMAGIQAVNRAWPALDLHEAGSVEAGWVLRAEVAAAMVVDSDLSVPQLDPKAMPEVSEMPY